MKLQKLIKGIRPYFFSGKGVYWKMNYDLKIIPGLENTHPNSDALSAFVVYNLAKFAGADIDKELEDLKPIISLYEKEDH